MRRLILASLRGSTRRLVAGGIAIVLSVGFMAAILFAMDSARAHITKTIGAQYTVADAVVENVTRPDAAERIAELPGVEAAARVGAGAASGSVHTDEGTERLPNQGVGSVPADESLRWQQAAEGRLPSAPDEVAVVDDLAAKYGLALGDTVSLRVPPGAGQQGTEGGSRELSVVGLVEKAGGQGSKLYIAEAALDTFVVGPPLEVTLRGSLDGVSDTELRKLAGPQASPITVQDKVQKTVSSLTGGVNMYGALLLGFAGIALFVSLLVVANTFTIVLAQRARELALYRCVGAGRGQVFGAVVVESAVLGVVTSVLGLLVGVGIAATAVGLLDRVLPQLEGAELAVSPTSLLVPMVVGTAVTVVAALAPARRATRVAPLAALRPELALRVRSSAGAFRLVAGALLILGGAAAMGMAVQGSVGARTGMLFGVVGGASSFVGVLLFGPLLAPAIVRLLGLGARLGGVPGRVSVANTVRNPRRTAATTSALLVGVTLITMLTVGAATAQRTSQALLDDQLPIDLMVASRTPEGLPSGAPRAVTEVEGVRESAVESSVDGAVGGRETAVSTVPLEAARSVLRDPAPIDGLENGTVLLGPSIADSAGVDEGDRVPVAVGGETREFRVAIASDPATPDVLLTAVDMAEFGASDASPRITGVWVRFADGLDIEAAAQRLERIQQMAPNAEVTGSAPQRALYQRIIDVMLAVAVALLGMAVLIALLGVGNTLSLSVLERFRENGLLRALGLTRGQLRGTLAIEAGLISGAAVVIGLILGIAYGILGVSTLFASTPAGTLPALPVGRLLLIVLVALAAGLLASVLPARTAANTPPARTL